MLTRMAKSETEEQSESTKRWGRCRVAGIHILLVGIQKGFSHFESLLVVSCKHTHHMTQQSHSCLIYPKEMTSVSTQGPVTHLYTFVCHTSRGTMHRLCSAVIYLLPMVTRDQWLRTWSGMDHSLYLWGEGGKRGWFLINLNQLSNSSSWFRDGQVT